MNTNYSEAERMLLISYNGEIDHHTCLELAKRSDDAIRKYLPSKVIFDFEKVDFMDSSGIGMLLGRYKQLIRFGGKAEMKNLNSEMKRIFSMSGIFKIIPMVEEEIING